MALIKLAVIKKESVRDGALAIFQVTVRKNPVGIARLYTQGKWIFTRADHESFVGHDIDKVVNDALKREPRAATIKPFYISPSTTGY